MAETKYSWPTRDEARLLGGHIERIDGVVKSTGVAKYTYDINLKNQLIARALGSPHSHCKVLKFDATEALKVPGVVHVHQLRAPRENEAGEMVIPEIHWQGDVIAVVAAETEGAASEGLSKLKVEYEVLDSFTEDFDEQAAEKAGRARRGASKIELVNEPGDDEDEEEFEEQELKRLFDESAYVVSGEYGIDAITHCCLETHGATLEWQGDKLMVHLSTQNVSKSGDGFASALEIPNEQVEIHCDFIGGGFGSKFNAGVWSIAAAKIAKETGRPVKLMLDRDLELKTAGQRPSGFVRATLGANKEGVVQVWDSHQWGTSGYSATLRGGVSPTVMPYLFEPPNYRRTSVGISTNNGPMLPWRAPNHPQACAMTLTVLDDLAKAMGADSFDIFQKNLSLIASDQSADVYADQMQIAEELMDWKAKWHPHGQGDRRGSIVEGLGMSLHKWPGVANQSSCQLKIHPDGSVESFCGTQDLGTGTRTVCAMLVAETLGLEIDQVTANIGSSKFPQSGPSGGSTTIGAVSESHRRASQDALAKLLVLVAEELETDADGLIARDGKVYHRDDPSKSLTWKQACRLLGVDVLEVTSNYNRGESSPLTDDGVGGVQMAHVEVDLDTGVVKMKKIVAVQDMGLIVNRKTAESQVQGALTMSIAFSLYEQRINDPANGAFLNAELRDYKLPRLGDMGELVVSLYEPDHQRDRGVIGLGEPPVISGGAAISNAVCNATGVRVPILPLTPKRVLEAIQKARV